MCDQLGTVTCRAYIKETWQLPSYSTSHCASGCSGWLQCSNAEGTWRKCVRMLCVSQIIPVSRASEETASEIKNASGMLLGWDIVKVSTVTQSIWSICNIFLKKITSILAEEFNTYAWKEFFSDVWCSWTFTSSFSVKFNKKHQLLWWCSVLNSQLKLCYSQRFSLPKFNHL